MRTDSGLLRSVRYGVAAIVLLGLTVLASYAWNMLIADQIFTDRCGMNHLGTGPADGPTMTWVGCSSGE
jgi:hypothetical protein